MNFYSESYFILRPVSQSAVMRRIVHQFMADQSRGDGHLEYGLIVALIGIGHRHHGREQGGNEPVRQVQHRRDVALAVSCPPPGPWAERPRARSVKTAAEDGLGPAVETGGTHGRSFIRYPGLLHAAGGDDQGGRPCGGLRRCRAICRASSARSCRASCSGYHWANAYGVEPCPTSARRPAASARAPPMTLNARSRHQPRAADRTARAEGPGGRRLPPLCGDHLGHAARAGRSGAEPGWVRRLFHAEANSSITGWWNIGTGGRVALAVGGLADRRSAKAGVLRKARFRPARCAARPLRDRRRRLAAGYRAAGPDFGT